MSARLDSRVYSHLAASARSSAGDNSKTLRGSTKVASVFSRARSCATWNSGTESSPSISLRRSQHRSTTPYRRGFGGLLGYSGSYRLCRDTRRKRIFSCRAEQGDEAPLRTDYTSTQLWQEELVGSIQYLREDEQKLVWAALETAFYAHDGQKRKSGEQYIIHPVACARILADMSLDVHSLCAGLLHDTVEDTDRVTFASIESEFGPAVRRIVEGETKVSKVSSKVRKSGSREADHAEDLQEMFLAMTEEVRIIIVKLADRLHNMRTLGHMPRHKQEAIAEETLQVFAPLAHLLGMNTIKRELEALSFRYKDPEAYAEVSRWLDVLTVQQEEVVLKARALLEDAFAKDEFLQLAVESVEVQGCMKEEYSVHKRMTEQNIQLTDIREVAQILIVLKMRGPATQDPSQMPTQQYASAPQVCYHVLGLIHNIWPPVPGRMKDYIATPKPNGYRSLHTTVMPLGVQGDRDIFPLELLIRTDNMQHVAEHGITKHRSLIENWHRQQQQEVLQGGAGELSDLDVAEGVKWLNSIRDWQEEFVGNMSPKEFVDTITGDLLGRRVFAFTPEGELLNLPRGATVVDYAYTIHTDIGNRMVAAKVNGNLVCPSHVLRNAEVVEIITYSGPPSLKAYQKHKEWMKYATTRAAYHKMQRFVRDFEALQPSTLELDDTDPDPSPNGTSPSPALPGSSSNGVGMAGSSSNGAAPSNSTAPREAAGTNGAGGVNGASKKGSSTFLDPITGALDPAQRFLFQLSIKCIDRNGLLADVSSCITQNDLSIKKYSGGGGCETGGGEDYHMQFEMFGLAADLPNMCAEIDAIDGVQGWSCSCIGGAADISFDRAD